jgi:hypothetical protein
MTCGQRATVAGLPRCRMAVASDQISAARISIAQAR